MLVPLTYSNKTGLRFSFTQFLAGCMQIGLLHSLLHVNCFTMCQSAYYAPKDEFNEAVHICADWIPHGLELSKLISAIVENLPAVKIYQTIRDSEFSCIHE